MATGGDQSLPGFPAREVGGNDGTDEATAEAGVPYSEERLILEHQCSEASDCSEKDRAKLLVGTHLTDFQASRMDSYEHQEASASLGAGCHDDSQMREMREVLKGLQIEVKGLREAIDSKNEELSKKTDELSEAREERNHLIKRLQWKDEDLEHERKSSQRMETELNRKIELLEREKDELQKTIRGLKDQMGTMQKEMQLMNNQKASVEDFEELQHKVERLSNRDCANTKPKDVASLEKYAMEFVQNVSSLMQPQGEATLASYKNGENGRHQSSDTNNDQVVAPNNGNGHDEATHGTVHRIRTTSDENNA